MDVLITVVSLQSLGQTKEGDVLKKTKQFTGYSFLFPQMKYKAVVVHVCMCMHISHF